jgi:hypothetical protein
LCEDYANDVLQKAFDDRYDARGDVVFSFGPEAGTGQVDGIIDGSIAVEIGVGSPKQIRASLLDLIWHPLPGKLLVLVDTPQHPTGRSVTQAGSILANARRSGVVIRLVGNPASPNLHTDAISLSEVVGKWIGETSKYLVRLFDGVEVRELELVVDESEDLFGRDAER